MKCDGCGRERTDEQLGIHRHSGIRFCLDKHDCHGYGTHGIYMEVAEEVMDMIIDGLIHSLCAESDDHGIVTVWSPSAKEQIGTHLMKRLKKRTLEMYKEWHPTGNGWPIYCDNCGRNVASTFCGM